MISEASETLSLYFSYYFMGLNCITRRVKKGYKRPSQQDSHISFYFIDNLSLIYLEKLKWLIFYFNL